MGLVSDVPPNTIQIGERLRPLSESAVLDILHSIQRVGQIQPITVVQRGEKVRLVTGHHRLVAARRLGIDCVSAKVLPESTTDDECFEIEIAENLHRADLTKEDRDRHIRFLAQIIAKKDAGISTQIASKSDDERQVSQNAAPVLSDGRRAGPQHQKGIVGQVAERTGLSKDTVRRALNPEEEAAKKAEREAARQEREAEQAEHDRQRNEAVASLPESIRRAEAAKEANRQMGRETAGADTATASEILSDFIREDRVAELEEAVRTLEARKTELEAENKLYGEMKVSWTAGGYEKVIADRDEQIRVLREQFHNENAEKVQAQNRAKWAMKELRKLGYSSDILIDAKTGEVTNG